MSSLIFELGFGLLLIGTGIIRYPFEKRQKKNKIIEDRKTLQERILLAGVSMGMFVLPMLKLFSPWLDFADFHLPLWLKIIGLLLIPLTWWLFYRSHHDLGQNWSVSLELREGHTLVTDGIYQRIRHPMYTAIWIWALSQFLLLANWIAGPAGLVGFGLLYAFRVKKEEAMMQSQFGSEYQAYQQRSGRIWPKWRA
ncbi:MAG: protein-S-isoprenylcysteine O-methyltransferase [Bacteroidota bacterium]